MSVSLDKLGDFYLRRGQSGDAERALACFEESNKTDKRLLEANPTSAEAARDVSVSHYRLAQMHMQAKHQEQAVEHLTACFAILDGFHRAGRPMDPAMQQLHQQLAGMFKQGA